MDLSNRCRAADVAAGCRRHLGRPAGRRPPSLPLLAATAAGGQLNKPAQTREEGGREDGARAEEEAPAPASIVRSVAVVRPYEVHPSLRRPSASSVIIGGDSPLRLRRRCFGVCRCRTGWERSYNLQDISISGHPTGM